MDNHKGTPGVAPVPAGTPTENLQGRTFIGGKSEQFQKSVRSGTAVVADTPMPEVKKPPPKEDAELCSACSEEIKKEHLYCSTCGLELGRRDIVKALGIELTEEDLSEYLFKGYLVKQVPLVHGKMATFKTLLPSESNAAETTVMEYFKDQEATNAQWSNVYAQIYLSYGWIKFDNTPLGDTAKKRREFIDNSIGVHLLDIASKKWNLFNRALAVLLEDPDALKN